MVLYDVWVDGVLVGRIAQEWGERALVMARNIRCLLVTDADGKLEVIR